jgi:transcriptional regulator with XRE-family HTH domain
MMRLQDKLYQLRKGKGLSQMDLAEAINVSRQAISKWETGTALPTIENFLSLSKLYGVSVDYLVDDEIESDMEIPVVKATAGYYKQRNKMTVTYIIVACCIAIIAIVVGFATHSIATVTLALLLIGTVCLVSYILRYLIRFLSYRGGSERRASKSAAHDDVFETRSEKGDTQ